MLRVTRTITKWQLSVASVGPAFDLSAMDPLARELLDTYLKMLDKPFMRWMLGISTASVVLVCIIAWRKGLGIWPWFWYAMLLGPVALVHIIFKSGTHGPSESSRAL